LLAKGGVCQGMKRNRRREKRRGKKEKFVDQA
jgi:hypothetical protein